MEELKPCPFCGHTKAQIMGKKIAGTYQHYRNSCSFIKLRYYIMCNKCHAKGGSVITPELVYGKTGVFNNEVFNTETIVKYQSMAIAAWNRRANES